jgi:hypothetical protein
MRLTMLLPCMLLLTACATTSHVITGTPRAPIDASAVSIYSTAPAAYVEIASIDASSRMSGAFGEQAKMDVVIARLKKEAASLGANGVLLQGTGSEYGGGVGTGVSTGIGGGGLSIGTGIFSASDHKTARGLAIFVPQQSTQ